MTLADNHWKDFVEERHEESTTVSRLVVGDLSLEVYIAVGRWHLAVYDRSGDQLAYRTMNGQSKAMSVKSEAIMLAMRHLHSQLGELMRFTEPQ